MLHGGEEGCGAVTSGGTESILMAAKVRWEWARAAAQRDRSYCALDSNVNCDAAADDVCLDCVECAWQCISATSIVGNCIIRAHRSQAYRDRGKALYGIVEPEMLIPTTAHAAFLKARSWDPSPHVAHRPHG